eukprot:s1358_g7.t1
MALPAVRGHRSESGAERAVMCLFCVNPWRLGLGAIFQFPFKAEGKSRTLNAVASLAAEEPPTRSGGWANETTESRPSHELRGIYHTARSLLLLPGEYHGSQPNRRLFAFQRLEALLFGSQKLA